jgi:toxin ParE1/3/4
VRDVVWAQDALDDANEIVAYIAADKPAAARKVLDHIEAAAKHLAMRSIGRAGRVSGTYEKSVVSLPYIIAYALRSLPSGDEQVVILRIIHTARNWPKGEWPK